MTALLYQLFAALCGWLEAILYARRGAESFSYNEHGGLFAQRAAAWLLAPLALWEYQYLGWWVAAELAPAALLFPACHDEAYNFTRLWLDQTALGYGDGAALRRAWQVYRYGYQSPTTTARNDFNGRTRTWLAIVGSVLLISNYCLLAK